MKKIPEIYLNIPIVFKGKFPDGYINNIEGWGMPKDILHSKLDDGTYKLLTLDIDVGNRCSLSCPHCFKKGFAINNRIIDSKTELTIEQLTKVIVEAKNLGLRSIKIIGAGEPFENEKFFPFIQEISNMGIHIVIFTKGHVLGSNELAKKYNEKNKITTAKQLITEIFKLNTSIMLGFNSFNRAQQDKYVGITSDSHLNYYKFRNNALKLMIEAGFSQYILGKPTRLALVAAPFKMENIDETFEIYKWGRVRNIYVAICPSTVSGNGKNEVNNIKHNGFLNYINNAIDCYVKIYIWSIQNRILTLDQFVQDGVSLYPGAHPCNQTAAGLYIIINGKVMRCPGADDNNHVVNENIMNSSLKEIWCTSKNYSLAQKEEQFNFYCIAREKNLINHDNFYKPIFDKVLIHFQLNK